MQADVRKDEEIEADNNNNNNNKEIARLSTKRLLI